ncbi:hypothetical protein M2145_002615 [Lachnospiraceae bacterium PF1-21]|uniref:PrgI family protein n=1 Tax=Ohessyouella blattaphilus TaxID=2949333 RepID=A0ABT1EN08_9FIRM|nr:PrgI family protein [Ohessyouella blattaphilus]MCP1111091.1 PrgI family protein [Ohessyouella blattaphilus]MCR8564485.1 PrgI family protein [Ohessyouella blattaphilus]
MKIEINRDFEQYKDDFFRGLNKRETISLGLLLVLNLGGVLSCLFLFEIPVLLGIYIILPLDVFVGLIGFFPARRMGVGFIEIAKRSWRLKFTPTIQYASREFSQEKDIRYEGLIEPKKKRFRKRGDKYNGKADI